MDEVATVDKAEIVDMADKADKVDDVDRRMG